MVRPEYEAVTATITRAPGRPASSPEALEQERITRIGALAISILKCMRSDPSRSRYRSERELRGWFGGPNTTHNRRHKARSSAPGGLRAACTRRSGLGQPRSGQLPTEADEAAEGAHGQGVVELAKAIIRALTAGNGRSALCDSEPELITRLDEDGVGYNPEDLPAALALLGAGEVPGLVYRLRRPMRYDSHPSTSPGRHGP